MVRQRRNSLQRWLKAVIVVSLAVLQPHTVLSLTTTSQQRTKQKVMSNSNFDELLPIGVRSTKAMIISSLRATANGETMSKKPTDPSFPLYALFEAAARAAIPKQAEKGSGAHDAFRFEWGRWVDDKHIAELQEQLNKVHIIHGGKVYDRLLAMEKNVATQQEKQSNNNKLEENTSRNHTNGNSIQDVTFQRDKEPRRFRVAGGDYWDCILHVLPKGMEWSGRWPTGSWAVVRALTGLAEIAMVRGPDRDGFMNKVTTMKLRGGSDGSLGSGREGAGGQDCVKYVGGAQRTYSGVSGKTMMLEVVLRPPIGEVGKDGDGQLSSEIEPLPPRDILVGLDMVEEIALHEEEKEKPPKDLPREKPLPETQATVIRDDHAQSKRLSELVPVVDNDIHYLDDNNFELEDNLFATDEIVIDDNIGPVDDEQKVVDEEGDDNVFTSDGFDEHPSPKNVSNFYEEDESLSLEQKNDEEVPMSLSAKMGLAFKKIGGLDDQLDSIVRRVLATRANPKAARRLGVNHVRGILLSGPPGCGKTLLARELSEMLGSREPQIVNGPEILDKFVGEAEKNVRALFEPAELEYEQLGDDSALHIIILDELDAIARRRGSVSGDTTGVRDSVVNQLLAKMDGVKEANNILVIGLTNRPELLDPALLRPGRLEVQLRVDLPDKKGRRDILRIHTSRMKAEGGLSWEAQEALEDVKSDDGIPAKTEFFTGAEIAGLVRSAASFALARSVEEEYTHGARDRTASEVTVTVLDLERALSEVLPALGKQDEVLEARFPHGISPCSPSMKRVMRDLERFTSTPNLLAKNQSSQKCKPSPALQSLLLVGNGQKGGTGVTALACWAASRSSTKGEANYVRLITSLDLLAFCGGSGDDSCRATALVERFVEASTMSNSLLVFDDVDQICAGTGPDGYSSLMISTLRALLRSPNAGAFSFRVDHDATDIFEREVKARSLSVIAATSRTDSVCSVLHELFDEVIVVPELSDAESIQKLFSDGIQQMGSSASKELSAKTISILAQTMSNQMEKVGCKTALRLLDRALAMSYRAKQKRPQKDMELDDLVVKAMSNILDDYQRDQEAAARISCQVN